MNVLVSHPTGNANLRAVLRALGNRGELAEFWTTLGLPEQLAGARWLPESARRQLSQRSFNEIGWAQTRVRPWREVTRLISRNVRFSSLDRHETGWASVDKVYQDLDQAVARRLRGGNGSATLVYAYEDGAMDTFLAASETGHHKVYELPIAHWRTLRALLEEEAERLPEWACTMEGLSDSDTKYARKDAEIELADHIVVASSFTRQSLNAAFGDIPIEVTPYGCPPPILMKPTERKPNEPIKLIFAGHLAQRKGIADLIAAVSLLKVDWRLTLAGPRPPLAPPALNRFLADPRVTWLGKVPHATLLEQMASAHVFVFPSIVEGFGMVITEALSAGLPVITTPHTAGPDILSEGKDGFIIPIRNPEALADRITFLAEDESRRRAISQAARNTAERMSWRRYETQIADLLAEWSRGS